MMREIQTRQVDVTEFTTRYPKYATVIAQAWSQALKETSALLSRTFDAGAVN